MTKIFTSVWAVDLLSLLFLLPETVRVAPDINLAGYPAAGYAANKSAGYWISC